MSACCRFISVLCFAILFSASTLAQESGPGQEKADARPSDARPSDARPAVNEPKGLADEQKAVSDELRVAKRVLQSAQDAKATTKEKPADQLTQEVELLKQTEMVLAQRKSAKVAEGELQTQLADLKRQTEAARAGGAVPPGGYSFLVLDHLRDDLASKKSRSESMAASIETATEAVVLAKAHCESKEQAVRRAKEDAKAGDGAVRAVVKLAELEERLSRETLSLRKQHLANVELAREIHAVKTSLLEVEIRERERDAAFSESHLQDQLVELETLEGELKRSVVFAQSNLEYAQRQWFAARQKLDNTTSRPNELVEEVEAKRLLRQLQQQRIDTLNVRLQRLSRNREIWKRRFDVINDLAETDRLIEWKKEAAAALAQFDRERRIQQQRVDELRNEIAGRDNKLQSSGDQAEEVRRWIREQQDGLQQLIQNHDRNIVSIESSRRLQSKLLGEIDGDVASWSASEWAESVAHYFGAVWDMELAKVDERQITVGKVVLSVLLVFAGFVIARLIASLLGRRLLGRFGMDEGAASALQTITFYVLLVSFSLSSLKYLNVPLTVFTIMGGALAIGVGFGSQNILNNFISGLILLAERPIKVGDLIQLNDLYGNVTKIGPRSTQIRTGEHLDIIVPNSKFLENNVINLTLGDDRIRTKVNVGVVYGSPTRDVSRLLQRAVEEHGQVLNQPKPFVWFVDFGDNSLNFQVHFWVKARTMSERTRIESDVRYRIDQLFRDASIVIAFPQSDVHFDAVRPIDIRVVQDATQTSPFRDPSSKDAA